MPLNPVDTTTDHGTYKGDPAATAFNKLNDNDQYLEELAKGAADAAIEAKTTADAAQETADAALPKVGGNVAGTLTVSGRVTASAFRGGSTAILGSASTGGSVSLRPNGPDTSGGETYVLSDGSLRASGNISSGTAGFIGTTTARLATEAAGGSISLRPNGYGSTSGEAYVLSNGNMNIAGTLTQNSDYRIKDDPQPIVPEHAAASLRLLTPITYVDLRAMDDGRRPGYLAHQAGEAGLGLLVSGEKDAVFEPQDVIEEFTDEPFAALQLQGLNYIGMIPYLHAAWLESDRRVAELERQIKLLVDAP